MNQHVSFLRESLKIEGIHRDPTQAEIDATVKFVALPKLLLGDVQDLVAVYAPGHKLRQHRGMDVRVGGYYPPRGGPEVAKALIDLLDEINEGKLTAYQAHLRFESLHPFTDGNGRSGRAIWLWQHEGRAPLGFLHRFYYETLAAADDRK